MRIDARAGTFGEVADLVPGQRPVMAAIRELVSELAPDAIEAANTRKKAVRWCAGPRPVRDAFLYAMPYPAHVRLGFVAGSRLPDPDSLLRGSGRRQRHLKLAHPSNVQAPAIRALVAAAHDDCRAALSIEE